MAFVNASGSKKFKPAWQSAETAENQNEEKENSMLAEEDLSENGDKNHAEDTKNMPQQNIEQMKEVGQEKKSKEWPPALKEYVKRSFDLCQGEVEKDRLERHFKEILTKGLDDGTAWTIDWKSHPLPKLGNVASPKEQRSRQQFLPDRVRKRKSWSPLGSPGDSRRSRSSKSRSSSRSPRMSPSDDQNDLRDRYNEARGKRGRGRGKRQGRGRGKRNDSTVAGREDISKKKMKNFK